MIRSMTAYASRTGTLDDVVWQWDLRSVNARGLDVKLRIPDGLEGLDVALRAAIKPVLSRGAVTIGLRLKRPEQAGDLRLDEAQLGRVLEALDEVQNRAFTLGVTLSQPTTADVLVQRGVLAVEQEETSSDSLVAALKEDFAHLLEDFLTMRTAEGEALEQVLMGQVDQIETHIAATQAHLPQRSEASKAQMQASLARLLDETQEIDETRLTQELAVLAVKQDVTEEIDRLGAHVSAARDILAKGGAVGRKLDFLSQEFNREANTLCSKAQFAALTAIGLDLKTVIDQMREQIQNVE